jgi:hypothetical protein
VAEINSMPLLVMCCQLCPKRLEGSLYAVLLSAMNLGVLLSFQVGSLFMLILGITQDHFTNLWILNLITTFSYLIPLPLLKYVNPEKYENPELKDGYDIV